MKKLSKKQTMALAGVVLYAVAYSAGKKDGINSVVKEAKRLEELNQNIGYMRALNDFVKGMGK